MTFKAYSSTENSDQLLEWIQANTPRIPGKIQLNPSDEFSGQLFSRKLKPTLELKIKANSSTEY